MSANVVLTCDGCHTAIVSEAKSTQDARRLNSANGGTHGFGRDLCADCASKSEAGRS